MKELTDTVLILDDEPHILDWLVEYVQSKTYKVEQVINVSEAIKKLEEYKYRVVVIDLNIPATKEFEEKLSNRGDLYKEYRGLFVAEFARTKGHRGRQVIVYSVHDSDVVAAQCEKIGINYLIKGRPREFKKELDNILSYDPTKWHDRMC